MANKCVACGQNGAKVLSDGKFFCDKCASKFGTCEMCIHGRSCEFFTNSAPIPQFVMQKIRQQTPHGYMEQIREVPNPERIKAFCLDKCICCKTCEDEKVRCLRQFGTCEKYQEFEF